LESEREAELGYMLARVEALADLGRYHGAIALAKQLLCVAPEDVRALCWAANLHLVMGASKEALEFALRATEVEPTNEWALQICMRAIRDRGDETALEVARTYVRNWPSSPAAWLIQAEKEMRVGQIQKAKASAATAKRLAPEWAAVDLLFAHIALSRGDIVGAAHSAQAALTRDPESIIGRNLMSDVLCRQRRYPEAVRMLHDTLRQHPRHVWAQTAFRNIIEHCYDCGSVVALTIVIGCAGIGALVAAALACAPGVLPGGTFPADERLWAAALAGVAFGLTGAAVMLYCRHRGWVALDPEVRRLYLAEKNWWGRRAAEWNARPKNGRGIPRR